jgi:hypothetical protein
VPALKKPAQAEMPQILPTVFNLTRGRISLCDITGVCDLRVSSAKAIGAERTIV